jgi:hypothetical protein
MNEIAGAFINWYTLIYLILHVRCKVDVYMYGPWVYQEVDSCPWVCRDFLWQRQWQWFPPL